MSAIMIAQITVKDPAQFQNYLARSKEIAGRYGAELLFAGDQEGALHGAPVPHQRVVVARFPDAAAARGWFDDPEYKKIVPLREAGSDQVLTVYSDDA